jgi:hypothetical protein
MGRYRQPLEHWWPSLSAVFILLIGLGLVTMGYFRIGLLVVAASAVTAFLFRLRLSDESAGLLVVRTRKVDLVVLGTLSLGLVILALWVPAPR